MTCFNKPSVGCLEKVLGLKRDRGQKERLTTETKSIQADSWGLGPAMINSTLTAPGKKYNYSNGKCFIIFSVIIGASYEH